MTNCSHGKVFDAIVIGTGFAGACTAARLVQAGQRICVLERGRKYEPDDFPMYPKAESLQRVDGGSAEDTEAPDLARWLWQVDQGLFEPRELGDVVAVQAAGYGGGSLIYANVHLRAPPEVFKRDWPQVYSRKNLDRYYDLAAFMLDVKPMPWRVAKTEQMQRAAKDFGGQNNWFRPPLAVHFGGKSKNQWGREQGKCDMRGQCCLGCRAQAKNSLDLNYLAIVEDASYNGEPLADIRTQAEVTSIEECPCMDCGARFTVHYNDLLFAEYDGENNPQQFHAKNVFLCAGAVNSTELLMRSKGLLTEEIGRRVGSRYHPNCDSVAAVFDCEQPQEADLGPTITGALLHENKTDWWALEFETGDDPIDPPDQRAEILCGDQKLRLVDAPIFDFGGFKVPRSRGMAVVSNIPGNCAVDAKLTSVDGKKIYGTLVSEARRLEDWLLIQDGGYPTDIEPLLGMLRSPLWLRRNRFDWQGSDEDGTGGATPVQQARMKNPEQPRFPLPTALTAVRGIPRRPVGISSSADLPAAAREFVPLNVDLDGLLPPWLRRTFVADHNAMARALAPVVRLFVKDLVDSVGTDLNQKLDLNTLIDEFDVSRLGEIGALSEEKNADMKEMLVHGLLQQGIQLLWGSEAALARRVNTLLAESMPKTAQGWADLLAPLLGWLMDYRIGNGHTGVLLIMGRDRYRGRLEQVGPDKRLTARLPVPLADSSRFAEESVLRDIAATWRGELRMNPATTIFGKSVTVHSQGGCPMALDDRWAVTKSTGEVIDRPGLYVMDAAAFPTSVGVNPSATILAVAEYKIEKFIKTLDDPGPRKPTDEKVQEWLTCLGGKVPRTAETESLSDMEHAKAVLDPISRLAPSAAHATTVGLTFGEVMAGQVSDVEICYPEVCDPEICDLETCDRIVDWNALNGLGPNLIKSFERAERRGAIEGKRSISMDLKATISNLSRFLSIQNEGLVEKVPLTGTVVLDGKPNRVCPQSSYMAFFNRPTVSADDQKPVRFLRYEVIFGDGTDRLVVRSSKLLRNDPRFDVWYDLSTLYFDLFEIDNSVPHMRGIMRVAPNDFVNKQLKSIEITPAGIDTAQQQWAYASFVRYFLGEVAGVYVEGTDLIKDLLGDLVGLPHGQ